MTKDNFLFTLIGLLLGTIIGFFITNAINQSAATMTGGQTQATQPAGSVPGGHPSVSGAGGSMAEVQVTVENARQNPTDLEAQLKAAELFYQIQRYDQAIEFLAKANEIQPENFEVIVNLGNTNFDAGKYVEAEKWYISALAKKSDNLDVRTDMGLTFIFREKPDYDRAITEFKRVLDADPNHSLALQNLTVAYTRKSDAAGAEATLAKLEKADPSNSALGKLREEIGKLK